jgi:glycine oxidase
MMNVAIIGNGILGSSIAFELHQKNPSLKISVIGPRSRKGGATNCAGAMLNSFAEIDQYSLKSEASLKHFELSYLATQMWPEYERRLIEAAGEHLPSECRNCKVLSGGCFSRGTYVINNCKADDLDDFNYDAILLALKEYNQAHTEIDPKNIDGYLPSPNARAQRGVLIHDEGWLNPKIVLNKIDSILEHKYAVNLLDKSVNTIKLTGSKITSAVLTDGTQIYADHFLLANGSDVSSLLERSGISLLKQKIYSGVGVSIEIQSQKKLQKNCIRTPNRGGACGLYTVPYFWGAEETNNLLIGASNFIDTVPHYNGRLISIAHLLEAASQEINQELYDAEVVSINVGNRPTSYDQYPMFGKTSIENLSIVTGTKRDGFHLAPLLAPYLANCILGYQGDELTDNIDIFLPERSPILDITYNDGIKMNVDSLMSEAYQHGFKAATIKQHNQLKASFEAEVRETHDQITLGQYGIPPLMYKLVRDGRVKI